tara:strand:- start:234 stop:890 length:657 start_codon:yes stop_codon:yes gene_type:complete
MNSLVDKFKEICTNKITLPDGGDIIIGKLNVEFQSELYKEIDLSENDYIAVLRYIFYVNKHICSQYRDYNFTYKDKLYLLNYWLSDINSTSLKELNLKTIDTLNNTTVELKLNESSVNIQFIQSNILQENKLLEFLLDKPSTQIGRMSVVFFDMFRFIHSIKIEEQEFLTENISIDDFFKLFELFSITHLHQITNKLSDTLQDLSSIREQEADITSFY